MERSTYGEIAEAEDRHWWYIGRRAVIRTVLDTTPFSRSGQVLEIGCGSGGNIELLSSYGSVYATEMDDILREVAIARHGSLAKIINGRAPDEIGFDGERFDLIAMFDVLEHIEKDRDTLKVVASKLTPNGKLILTCPAYRWLWSVHDERAHHYRRYTRRSLGVLGRSVGLIPIKATYFNSILLPAVAAVRVSSRILSFEADVGMKTPSRVINSILTGVFSAEASLVRFVSLPVGVSIAIVMGLGKE